MVPTCPVGRICRVLPQGAPANPPFRGLADCQAIGSGPGVSCLVSIGWNGFSNREISSVMLFGVDPENPGIRLLEVDADAETTRYAMSALQGDAVTFRMKCPDYTRRYMVSCSRVVTMRAPPSAKHIEIAMGGDFTLRMGLEEYGRGSPAVMMWLRQDPQGASAPSPR